MNHVPYMAWRYLRFHWGKTVLLVSAVIYETNKKAIKSDRTDSYRDAAAELISSNATKIIEKPDVMRMPYLRKFRCFP